MKNRIYIPEATGATVTRERLNRMSLEEMGQQCARGGGICRVDEIDGYEDALPPAERTALVNGAIEALHENGGGTLYFPAGEYRVYTLVLLSNVNLYLEKGAKISAAKTDVDITYLGHPVVQRGEGGNYLAPEVNRYVGLQDHGHTYFRNSLIYAANQENIMIYGEGVIDGSFLDEETGVREFVLLGADPQEPKRRSEAGYYMPAQGGQESWFGNKGLAFVDCKNIVLADFSMVIGGHFAIITEGVEELLVDGILVDTNRDALDVDCCRNVTIRNSTFNSLTDDGIVVKASYGAGRYFCSENILIEDCTVSGYDAGTVYNKTYTTEKLVADDMCGPTGRIKLGTESTCGYKRVTVRRTRFERCRGFALEAVDGAPLTDIIFEDCVMKQISSSPIFIRAGERGRFPVTGNGADDSYPVPKNSADGSYPVPKNSVDGSYPVSKNSADDSFPRGSGNVRLDNANWILPDADGYDSYPAKSYKPSYNRTKKVCIDGVHEFAIVDDKAPAKINEANIFRDGETLYPRRYDKTAGGYVPDKTHALSGEREAYYYANACGYEAPAGVSNIRIKNVVAEDVDPRYPILLMGLTDSPITHVELENVRVTYRGGITMEQAVEQRQIFTEHTYSQYGTKALTQRLPWLVNPFFAKNEALLPRADWDEKEEAWTDDAYNVPELPEVYPEPSNWGILPAYGIYARHVKDLYVSDVEITATVRDERHVAVLDDVENAVFDHVTANQENGIALVTNHFRRRTNREYVPEEPYFTTSVEEFALERSKVGKLCLIEVNAPAPGTPPDSLYPYPTAAIPENGYRYRVKAEEYPLPKTVYLKVGK